MNSKWLIGSVLIVVLIGLCAASLFATWQGVQMVQASGVHFRGFSPNTVAANGTDQKELTVSGPVNLSVQNEMGDIDVVTGPDSQVKVKAEKTAWGSSDADAQSALKELKVVVVQNGNDIAISVEQPAEVDFLHIGPGVNVVKFTISVPKSTAATLRSSNGDISLDGTAGSAVLGSNFGDVTVSNLSGELQGTSNNGTVTARSISSTAPIKLSSDFGNVTLDTAKGSDVTVSSNNGHLVLNNVTAGGLLKANSQFGDIDIGNSQAATLQAQSNNGMLRLNKLAVTGSLTARSDFGSLVLTGASAGSYDLTTQNGKISADDAQGAIKAHSDLGDISISSAQNATLDLSSNNGAITFSGTLGAGPHAVSSDFGNILLTLPADTPLNVDLKTDFGKVSSDFSIKMQGTLDAEHWVGSINGGGTLLTAKTNNGNITLQSSK